MTIDRPEAMNALDVETLSSLRELLLGLREDEAVRASCSRAPATAPSSRARTSST